jgi:hypothetical protein
MFAYNVLGGDEHVLCPDNDCVGGYRTDFRL